MNKEEIICLAESMGFKLDYDKWENIDNSEFSNGEWLRFISIDDGLDERDLRWIWYKGYSDEQNTITGEYIQARLKRKREILNILN